MWNDIFVPSWLDEGIIDAISIPQKHANVQSRPKLYLGNGNSKQLTGEIFKPVN